MTKVGIIGLGKMGLSHFSISNARPDVEVVGVCDSSGYVLDIVGKYTGVTTYGRYEEMLDEQDVEAVIVSTPSRLHAPMVRACLERGLHVFCEKPFCLDPADSLALAALAEERGLVTQVGYHNRFVGAFTEVKRLLEVGAIGTVTQVRAEAYGPVVLKARGSTWRSKKEEGGGVLYDYAAHPLDLLTWYFGAPDSVAGTSLDRVFSSETEDQVLSTIRWIGGPSGQLSANWSDESQRKMTTRVSIWGAQGRINADRQECQVYLRDGANAPDSYVTGWNVRYTTDLTAPVDFYVRGEEYSAQLDMWVRRIATREVIGNGDFADAAVTDRVLAALVDNTDGGVRPLDAVGDAETLRALAPRSGWWRRRRPTRRMKRSG